MAKNSFVAEVTFNLPVGAKQLYRVAHRLVFSQNLIPHFVIFNLVYVHMPKYFTITVCQHKLQFS